MFAFSFATVSAKYSLPFIKCTKLDHHNIQHVYLKHSYGSRNNDNNNNGKHLNSNSISNSTQRQQQTHATDGFHHIAFLGIIEVVKSFPFYPTTFLLYRPAPSSLPKSLADTRCVFRAYNEFGIDSGF